MKPTSLLSLFFTFSLLISFTSCHLGLNIKRGNGNVVSVQKDIAPFTSLDFGGNYTVNLEHGDRPSMTIKTDENLLEYINVESYNDKLYINNMHTLSGTEGIEINITYTTLDDISSSGSSTIKNIGSLKADHLKIDMSGAGAIEMDLEVKNLELALSGAGVVKLTGYAENENFDISGAGGLKAYMLQSKNCVVSLSGIGGAQIYVTEKLEATISGIGGISYRGQPQDIQRHISGLGKIQRSEEYFDEAQNP